MRRVCVYCGSNTGNNTAYALAAQALAASLIKRNIGLVYGGSNQGIMGILADAMLAGGGEATGVIPAALVDKEVAHPGLTQLHIVDSMHARKSLMAELSDGFIALPGGFGTIEELVEMMTWAQLGFHAKPCGILNVASYYDSLLAFFDRANEDGFVRGAHRRMVVTAASSDDLLEQMLVYRPEITSKWAD
jgi:uncharacterized protein (TIGR00730 family)